MKIHTSLCLLFAAMTVVTAGPVSAGTNPSSAIAHPVVSVERNSSSTITRGATTLQVLKALSYPTRMLNADTWVYTGYNAGAEQSGNDHCTTLIVSFRNACVADLRLVNDRAEQVIAMHLQIKTSPGAIVATKD